MADETTFGAFALPDSPLIVGGSRFVFLGLLTIGAIFATGGHSRHRALNQPIRLFVGVAGAVLLVWAGGIARGLLSELVLPIVTTAGILWLSLLLVRQFSEWFLRDVWPRARGTGTALLVGNPALGGRFERAVAAPGGDYRVAGYVATEGAVGTGLLGTIDNLSGLIEAHRAEATRHRTAEGEQPDCVEAKMGEIGGWK